MEKTPQEISKAVLAELPTLNYNQRGIFTICEMMIIRYGDGINTPHLYDFERWAIDENTNPQVMLALYLLLGLESRAQAAEIEALNEEILGLKMTILNLKREIGATQPQ